MTVASRRLAAGGTEDQLVRDIEENLGDPRAAPFDRPVEPACLDALVWAEPRGDGAGFGRDHVEELTAILVRRDDQQSERAGRAHLRPARRGHRANELL